MKLITIPDNSVFVVLSYLHTCCSRLVRAHRYGTTCTSTRTSIPSRTPFNLRIVGVSIRRVTRKYCPVKTRAVVMRTVNQHDKVSQFNWNKIRGSRVVAREGGRSERWGRKTGIMEGRTVWRRKWTTMNMSCNITIKKTSTTATTMTTVADCRSSEWYSSGLRSSIQLKVEELFFPFFLLCFSF